MPGRRLEPKPLSEDALEALRAKLAAMRRPELEANYTSTHNACQYVKRLPSPQLIQEFVQAWKEMRRRKTLQ